VVPFTGRRIGRLQGSTLLVAVGAMTSGCSVGIGSGVKVSVGVGGMGVAVAVGSEACVMATFVHARAMAVFAISAGLTVGVDAVPQAERVGMIRINKTYRSFLFICSP